MRKLEYLMLALIAVLAVLISLHQFGSPSHTTTATASSALGGLSQNDQNAFQSSASSTSLVAQNEIVNNTDAVNSNFWFNSKFYPGKVVLNTTTKEYECETLTAITAPHICVNSNFFTNLLSGPLLYLCGGSSNIQNISDFVGYLGFPQSEPNTNIFTASFPNLISGSFEPLLFAFPSKENPYQNLVVFNNSVIKAYGGSLTGYYYAVNNTYEGINFGSGYPIHGKSTLVIPSVSCGSTFPDTYVLLPGQTVSSMPTLTGFMPSVFLSSNTEDGIGELYIQGLLSSTALWINSVPIPSVVADGFFESPYAYQVQRIAPNFNFGMPTSNYAPFPSGNKGYLNYLNQVVPFYTEVNASYFGKSPETGNVILFSSNTSISSGYTTFQNKVPMSEIMRIAALVSIPAIEVGPGLSSTLVQYNRSRQQIPMYQSNSYTLPALQAFYYPSLQATFSQFSLPVQYSHLSFATGGFFPICIKSNGNVGSNCTFEDPQSINPISYQRTWSSYYLPLSNLANQPAIPGFDSFDPLNNFTIKALDSFCFYGESFNTNTGVYTSPSYTRVIAPTAAENYTVAAGLCNSFYNSSNCFIQGGGNDLNFEQGIFISNIACTPSGIVRNITDAWIRSLYVANNGGSYCGDFLGEKNMSNPTADSTVFMQKIYNCPAFNSNSSSVPIVITIKNVGTTNITNPYFIALFRDTNVSQMFYSSPTNSLEQDYSYFSQMLNGMRQQDMTGVIGLTYNSSLDTNMYTYKEGYPMNPIPIESLFSASPSYLNGPYNNSLLGMWFYRPGTGGPDNVTRTSNTFLVHSSSDNTGVPLIVPNGTATFTVEVPLALFKELLQGKYKAAFYFGNLFNVSWGDNANPVTSMGNIQVNPLLQSAEPHLIEFNFPNHNNEILNPSSPSPSPPWQYLVGYTVNFSESPFSNISIYTDNFNFSVLPSNLTQNAILANITTNIAVSNGTGNYALSGRSLIGSSVSCFASPDNINDFSVFWSTRAVSPPNLAYAVHDFYKSNSAIDNLLITRWRGLVFMPYSDQAVLSVNNLPSYKTSEVSFMLQKPAINSNSTSYSKEAFAYFDSGGLSSVFSNLSSFYKVFSSTFVPAPAVLSSSSYGFTLTANNLIGNASILRVVGSDSFANFSKFANSPITINFSGMPHCLFSESTNSAGVFSSNSTLFRCFDGIKVNQSIMTITSNGPFQVDLYNNSIFNASNTSQHGTYLVSGNFTLSTPSNGVFSTTLNISKPLTNGFSLLFKPEPRTIILKNSNVYLYNINGSPFSCNIINDYNPYLHNIGASEIAPGEYHLTNGAILCNLTSPFSAIRAVFMNATNNEYLGSGDIFLQASIQYMPSNSLYITYNGAPLNSQEVNLSGPSSDSCDVGRIVVTNGILNYSGNCQLANDTLSFASLSNKISGALSITIGPTVPAYSDGAFIAIQPIALADNPSSAAEITIPSSITSNIPITFSLPNLYNSCNSIKVLSNFSYPYSEVPFQTISDANGNCYYAFIGNSAGSPYTLFINTPSAPAYPDSWFNYSETNYNVQFNANGYSGNLLSMCSNGIGPCISGFKFNGSGVGSLLVNNVSASSPSISNPVSGPVMDCFSITYSALQQAIFQYSGFGDIHYSTNKAYQEAVPTEAVTSNYCFFDNSPVITDLLQFSGNPLSFNVSNDLFTNFSTAETGSGEVYSVPRPIDVGYSGYNNVTVLSSSYINYTLSVPNTVSYSCANYTLTQMPLANSSEPIQASDFTSGVESPYCVVNESRTYTENAGLTSSNNVFATTSGETIGFMIKPGNITGPNGPVFYDSCQFIRNETVDKAQLFVNGTWTNFNPNNPGESAAVNRIANLSGYPLLVSPSNNVYINSCPVNSTIVAYSMCTNPNQQITPRGGSYSGIEALPASGGTLTTGFNLSLGGGCFIGNLNGVSYSCAPTDGKLSYSNSNDKSSSSSSVSESQYLYNSSSAPTTPLKISFSCSGTANITTNSKSANYDLSCSYPSSSTSSNSCSAAVSVTKVSSGEYSISGICSVSLSGSQKLNSDTIEISNFNINSEQSETTGISSNFLCGNLTNVISSDNVPAGWSWSAFTTTHTTNLNGIPEVGGCEAGRSTYSELAPFINTTIINDTTGAFYQTYSCASGYSGSVLACSTPVSIKSSITTGKCVSNLTYEKTITTYKSENGTTLGGLPKGCKPFSAQNYSSPTLTTDCQAYGNQVQASTNSSFILQYDNYSTISSASYSRFNTINERHGGGKIKSPPPPPSTQALKVTDPSGFGVGLALVGQPVSLNIYIPNGYNSYITKDSYITSVSVSQKEISNMFTNIYPTNLLLSNSLSNALFKSSLYSYDMLNLLLLQNPYFGIFGMPGFVNGSTIDYAMNIFSGGTSNNCVSSQLQGNYGIFKLGEGELCSGNQLPKGYENGVYLSLGSLNEGLHAVQFYSVAENQNQSQPTINVADSVGTALNLNSACSNGNSRVFTMKYPNGGPFVNITSDENCNPINNELYGYVVNCMYQSPGNKTFSVSSQYYLAYNLPTLWNISYTILVSPKAYGVVPVPVYQVGNSVGSILSLYPPASTQFSETGLPNGYTWKVIYDNIPESSSRPTIDYTLESGTYSFSIPTLSNSSSVPDCTSTYTPSPSSGALKTGYSVSVIFLASTQCTSVFSETGLPNSTSNTTSTVNSTTPPGGGLTTNKTKSPPPSSLPSSQQSDPLEYQWTVNYNGFNESSSTPHITFTAPSGSYVFKVYNITVLASSPGCSYEYVASPSSSSLTAGDNESISFSEKYVCVPVNTIFDEQNLPSGASWDVTYNGTTLSSTSSSITFSTLYGSYQYTGYSVVAVNSSNWQCTYTPSPSSSVLTADNTYTITFSSSSCSLPLKTTFTQNSGVSPWSVTYDGDKKTSSGSTIVFNVYPGTYSFSVATEIITTGEQCSLSTNVKGTYYYTYTPSPSSGSLKAGGSQSVSYKLTSTTCSA